MGDRHEQYPDWHRQPKQPPTFKYARHVPSWPGKTKKKKSKIKGGIPNPEKVYSGTGLKNLAAHYFNMTRKLCEVLEDFSKPMFELEMLWRRIAAYREVLAKHSDAHKIIDEKKSKAMQANVAGIVDEVLQWQDLLVKAFRRQKRPSRQGNRLYKKAYEIYEVPPVEGLGCRALRSRVTIDGEVYEGEISIKPASARESAAKKAMQEIFPLTFAQSLTHVVGHKFAQFEIVENPKFYTHERRRLEDALEKIHGRELQDDDFTITFEKLENGASESPYWSCTAVLGIDPENTYFGECSQDKMLAEASAMKSIFKALAERFDPIFADIDADAANAANACGKRLADQKIASGKKKLRKGENSEEEETPNDQDEDQVEETYEDIEYSEQCTEDSDEHLDEQSE